MIHTAHASLALWIHAQAKRSALARGMQPSGHVSDVHFGLATVHDLVGVIAGAKHRNESHVTLLLKQASAWHGEG